MNENRIFLPQPQGHNVTKITLRRGNFHEVILPGGSGKNCSSSSVFPQQDDKPYPSHF